MKKCYFTYDDWKCITRKRQKVQHIDTDLFSGYVGFMELLEVTNLQVWQYNDLDITVCDSNYQWLTIMPDEEYYCITAMMDERGEVKVWYIDMIESRGVENNIPFFIDLYLDLIVYPDGSVITDDRDELDEAWNEEKITKEQYELALHTEEKLRHLSSTDPEYLMNLTRHCMDLLQG